MSRALEATAGSGKSSLPSEGLELDVLITASLNDGPIARPLVARAGHDLGVALADLLNLTNPGTVVLDGSRPRAGQVLLASLREVLQARRLSASRGGSQVLVSAPGDEAVDLGSATLVLQSALRQSEHFIRRGRVSSPLNCAS